MPTRLPPGLAALCLAGTAGCASTTETRSAPEPTGDNRADQPQRLQSGVAAPHLPPATARQHANREIKAALDDLECGKDFYAAYEPKNREISERVSQMFGRGPL
ncbi:hypothetical protein [Nonomuraea sp. NPDC049480]|uniref:hypothetical protein n=1 Tax=Nonomuraea sp. NPDC049480 TaxID=3364353 RepID=UPI00378A2DF6